MESTHIGPALVLIGAGIGIVSFMLRKSWLGVATLCSLALSQLPHFTQFPSVAWVGLAFSTLFVTCVITQVWRLSRDPDWRASWRR